MLVAALVSYSTIGSWSGGPESDMSRERQCSAASVESVTPRLIVFLTISEASP